MTISLELAKQLYEKGLKIETERTYCDIAGQWREEKPRFILYESNIAKARQQNGKESQYSAPSTDELLSVMPYKINKIDYLVARKAFEGYYVQYWDYENEMAIKIKEDSFPEALGKMCLWLLSNGYVYSPEKKMLVADLVLNSH